MQLLINSEISKIEWRSFLKSNKFSTPFQSPEFFDLYNSIQGYHADVFAVKQDDILRSLCVVLLFKENNIKGFFSRRAIIYGGPLIEDKASTELSFILQSINKHFRYKAIYIETRNLNDYSLFSDVFISCGYRNEPYVNINVDITDLDDAIKKFNGEKRRQIKKAFNNGLSIKTAKNKEEVKSLYIILKELYKSKVKKPLPGLSFFLSLFELFEEHKNGFVSILIFEDKIIGGAFCPIINRTVYDWYRCGMDKKYKNLYPSAVAVFSGMAIGHKNGLCRYDFMGAGNINIPSSVRDFKSQFGGDLVEYGRFKKVNNSFFYNLGKLGLKILSI